MELQVGDRIYKTHGGKIYGIDIVQRVTKTKAICKIMEFKREYNSLSNIRAFSSNGWAVESYELETPELIATLKKQKAIALITDFNFKSMPIEKLEQILAIINEHVYPKPNN